MLPYLPLQNNAKMLLKSLGFLSRFCQVTDWLQGLSNEMEVQVEDMPAMLPDIEVAKKFPSDWNSVSVGAVLRKE